jgi:hypothetical protein
MKNSELKNKINLTRDGLKTRINNRLDEYIGFAIDTQLSSLIIEEVVDEVFKFHLSELLVSVSMIDHPFPEQKDSIIDDINKIIRTHEQVSRDSYSLV